MELAARFGRSAAENEDGGAVGVERRWEWSWRRGLGGAPLGMELAAQLRWSAAGNGAGGAVEVERRWEWSWRRGCRV